MRDGTFDSPEQMYECVCAKCKNKFCVPHHDDFLPDYCCYCGEEFEQLDEEDDEGEVVDG